MPHTQGFRDPVVRPKVALIGIAITLAVWFVVFGCAGLVRSCGSRETSAPRSAADAGAPAPSRDIVRTITLKPGEWSEWVDPPLGGFRVHYVELKTSDNTFSAQIEFEEAPTKTFENVKWGDTFDWGRDGFPNQDYRVRFKHPSGGSITVKIAR